MTSIVVHYKELALKGQEPPVVRPDARPQSAHRARRPRRRSDPLGHGPHRDRARRPRRRGPTSASGCGRVFGIANFSHAGRGSARLRRAGGGHPRRPRRSAGRLVPRQRRAAPTSAFRSRRRRSSARSAASSRRRRAGASISIEPALTIHIEMLPDEAFYFFGKEPGRRRPADAAPAAASRVCCRAASIRRSRRIG